MEKKILIVDDEVHICALLSQVLEDLTDAGVELLVTQDGEEGLRLALAEKPDLLFLDAMLPNLDGYQICGQLKQSPHGEATYVIMLTARGQAIDRQRAQDVQANEYITKPFDPDMILEKASTILGIPR